MKEYSGVIAPEEYKRLGRRRRRQMYVFLFVVASIFVRMSDAGLAVHAGMDSHDGSNETEDDFSERLAIFHFLPLLRGSSTMCKDSLESARRQINRKEGNQFSAPST